MITKRLKLYKIPGRPFNDVVSVYVSGTIGPGFESIKLERGGGTASGRLYAPDRQAKTIVLSIIWVMVQTMTRCDHEVAEYFFRIGRIAPTFRWRKQ